MKSKIKKIVAAAMAVLTLSAGIVGATGCGYCAHNLEVHEKEPSTCLEHGHGYSYTCTKCGKLFAYSEEKGLYEIDEAETLPLGEHTLPEIADMDGKLGVRLKEGKTTAETLWDYEMTYKCALCEQEVAVPETHLGTIVPANLNKTQPGNGSQVYKGTYAYDNGDKETGRPYTQIDFRSDTIDSAITIDPYNYIHLPYEGKIDQTKTYGEQYEWVSASHIGSYQRFPLYIPFSANQTRYVYYVIKNTSDTSVTTDPIEIEWSIDGDHWSDRVTINPGEIKVLSVSATESSDLNVQAQYLKVRNPNNSAKLGKKMSIEVAGMFYIPSAVAKLDIDNSCKVEYTAGEKFDPTGIKVYATYEEASLGKTLRIEDMEFSCGDKPLTVNDKVVTISYGGKKVSFNINVTEGANNG